jgi:hypothetical protein
VSDTLEQFALKIAERVRQRIGKHGHHETALYAVSRQGREHYHEFPIEPGADRDEIVQKMRDWIERKHIVRYAFVSEAWSTDAKGVAPSQCLDKQEIVMLSAADRKEPFRSRDGMAVITRPHDDPRKSVLGEFKWEDSDRVMGRFSGLFLPLLPPAETPKQLADRIKWLTWRNHPARVVAGCLIAVMDEVWEDIKGDDIAAKKENLIGVVSKLLPVLIAEFYEEPGKAEQMVKDMAPPQQEEAKPIERAPVFPLAVPGYATKRARNVVGQLLRILEGEMGACNDDELNDNILAALLATSSQIARVSNTQERNRLIAGVQDFVDRTMKETRWAMEQTQGWTAEYVKATFGEPMEILETETAKLN